MHVAMSLREVYSELILTYGPRKLGKLNTDRSPGHGDAEHDSVVIISSVSRRFWLHLLLLRRRQSSQLSSSLFVPSEVRIRAAMLRPRRARRFYVAHVTPTIRAVLYVRRRRILIKLVRRALVARVRDIS
jgi:hypothetical protein